MRTLEAMCYLVRKDSKSEFVFNCVQRIVGARSRESVGEVAALFFFARDAIRYVEDPPGLERIADFERTMDAGFGDCDDKCVWLATALYAIGVPVRFVVQSYGETWDHVYLEFYDWDQWRWTALDPTADGHTGVVAGVGWRQTLPVGGYEMTFPI